LIVLVSVISGCSKDSNKTQQELHLATASLGGAFYPVGQSVSNLVTLHAENISMLPVVSAGAIQNPRLVDSGEVDVGITNGYMAWLAINGTSPYEKHLNLKALGTIHASILHMVTLENSPIKSFEDLRGKRVAVGPAGGGTYGFLVRLLAIHDMTIDDIRPSYLSYTDGFTQLGDGNVDAAFALAGFPTAAVQQTLATNNLAFIELSDKKIAEILEKHPYYSVQKLPKETYRLKHDVNVIGVSNMLVVNANMDEDLVFKLTQAIYGNMEEFRKNNAIAKQIYPEDSLQLPIPLHDGAARFFKQAP
jgi:TRAP transporter TAXI family solute receptor